MARMGTEARQLLASPGCQIRLTKKALIARDRRTALETPSTSRLGMMLVNSDPGPRVIRSALAIAFSVAGSGRHLPGRRRIREIGERLLLIRVSPVTRRPFSRVASRTMFLAVAGWVFPAM